MTEYMQNVMAIQMPQGLDWVWILLIVLVIFGGKKLPDLARNLGKGMSEFKKGLNEVQNEVQNTKDEIVNEIKKAPTNDDSKKTV
ncbi:MAG: twin-arginine translocase TatA/TatE family subunit [Sedimentisphaerales bacterium]|jgi:sec-independent protein translocase protein TatA